MRKFLYFGFLFLFLLNCSKLKEKSDEKQDVRDDVTVSFENFFKEFSTDSVYQVSHIKYPLPYYSLDIEDNEEQQFIYEAEWHFEDFSNNENTEGKEYDSYKTSVKKIGDNKMIYIQKGIDNGILVEHYFTFSESDWSLVRVFDRSN